MIRIFIVILLILGLIILFGKVKGEPENPKLAEKKGLTIFAIFTSFFMVFFIFGFVSLLDPCEIRCKEVALLQEQPFEEGFFDNYFLYTEEDKISTMDAYVEFKYDSDIPYAEIYETHYTWEAIRWFFEDSFKKIDYVILHLSEEQS